jgi:hypothetical protein
VNGVLRSSWLVEPSDGHMPYTALAKAAMEAAEKVFKSSYDNPEERPTSERCISSLGHPPLQAISAVIPSQIVQTSDALVIWTEDTDGARIIHLTGDPPPNAIRTRAGYSAGRWEGDTLMVETTHFSAYDPGGRCCATASFWVVAAASANASACCRTARCSISSPSPIPISMTGHGSPSMC